MAPLFEQHRIYAPLDKEWAQGWLNQLANFPADQNDDYVDSTSQALKMLRLGGGLSTSLDAPARKRTGGTRGYW